MDIEEEQKSDQFRVTAAELRQFIERFERLEAEKKDIAGWLGKEGRAGLGVGKWEGQRVGLVG